MKSSAEPLLALLLVVIVGGLLFGSCQIQLDKYDKEPAPVVSTSSPVR